MKENVIIVLIYISLGTDDVEYTFMCCWPLACLLQRDVYLGYLNIVLICRVLGCSGLETFSRCVICERYLQFLSCWPHFRESIYYDSYFTYFVLLLIVLDCMCLCFTVTTNVIKPGL